MPTRRLSILAVALGLAACGPAPEAPAPSSAPAALPADGPATPSPAAPPPETAPTAAIAAQAVTDRYDCGGTALEARMDGGNLAVTVLGEVVVLAPAEAASGAKFQGVLRDGAFVEWWTKGAEATLKVGSQDYPTCQRLAPPGAGAAAPAPSQRYRARGNEPFWSIDYDLGSLAWRSPESPDPVVWGTANRQDRPDGLEIVASREGSTLSLVAVTGPCRDRMSGMPYPHLVSVTIDGTAYEGCGGEALDLLLGKVWTVETLGDATVEGRAPTLEFSAEGRVAGGASCNRWNASATLDGEGLRFGQAVSTMMACEPAAMAQEKAFLDALATVTRHDVDEAGALRLLAGDTTVLVATPGAATE